MGIREALSEPSKDGREDRMCFLDRVLVPPQTTEARRAAKLPGQSALPVSAIEACREKLLRRASGAALAIEQPQLTFDPQQLPLAPMLRVAPGYLQRFPRCGKPLGDAPGRTR